MSSSITATSYSASYQAYQTNSSKDEFKQDFQALGQALQSGDLQAAQDAFSKIEQARQNRNQGKTDKDNDGDGSNSSSGTNDTMKNDMQALKDALSSGNLQDAQDAFSKLQSDMKANGMHHHHHNAQSSTSTTTDSTATSDTTSTSTSSIYA